MRRGARGTGLGKEQRRHEEGMVAKFDDPDLAVVPHAAHAQAMRLERVPIGRIHAVVAVKVLDGVIGVIELRRSTARNDSDGLLLPDERARKRRDDEPLGIRIRLGMIGVLDPQDIARELDDRVLKSSSRADERHATLSRISDGDERAIHAAIRTCRRNPDPVELSEARFCFANDRVRRNPLEGEVEVRARLIRELMGDVTGVVVADDTDPRAHQGASPATLLIDSGPRPARLATIVVSSPGSTGFGTCML